MNTNVITNDFLEHYGVLGMKWGIRRTPEQLGHHKIKKGTKVYVVQGKGSSGIKGLTRVAYLPPDRAELRDVDARHFNNRKGPGGRAREVTYKLTEDLNIPSREELKSVYKQLLDDPKIREAVFREDVINTLSILGAGSTKRVEKLTSEFLEEYKTHTPEERFDIAASLMSTRSFRPFQNPTWKKVVVEKLKAKGYNAIVDESGLTSKGVQNSLEPIIIFDGETVLREISSKELSDQDISKAGKKHRDWSKEVNAYNRKEKLKKQDLQMDAFLEHYGIPRRSGRYPWGSGKSPYQSIGGVAKASKKKTSLKSIIAKKKASIKKKQRANTAKAKAKKRKEYLDSPSKLYKHRKEFTKDEIDAAMKQFKWEKELRDLSKNELDTGARYVDAFVKYASSGINAYNTIARVVNTFGDESSRFSYIEPIDAAKNKKKDK